MAINLQIRNGKSNSEDSLKDGLYPFFDRSSKIKFTNDFLYNGQFTIVPGEGIFIPKFYDGKFNLHQRAYALYSENVIPKFLFYFVYKNFQNFYDYAVGSTVPSLRLSSFDWIKNFNFPHKNLQQKIIDIIEPIEKKILLIKNLKKLFLRVFNFEKYQPHEKMIKRCKFIKGLNCKNETFGSTLFLNVSAANNKPNKFCNEDANTFYGDVTLSLDGNTGLVNNCLNGFNGYLYKVQSNIIQNWQIYFSLLTKENQKIIKENEIGTTIKHSTGSKNKLILFKFKNAKLLSNLFSLLISLDLVIEKLEKLKSQLIDLLVR